MAKKPGPQPLGVAALCTPVCASDFDLDTTNDLPVAEGWLGQDRAVDAIRMAASINHDDFNAFVLGTPGSGRRRVIRSILKDAAAERSRPSDWVYVNNFQFPDKPIAIELPAGTAIRLGKAMETLIDELANDIPALFDSDDYQARRRAIEQSFSEFHEEAMGAVFEKARARHVAILRTPMGFTVVGMHEGEVLKPEIYDGLSKKQQAAIDAAIEEIQEELAEVLKTVPAKQKEHRRQVEELNISMATAGVDDAIKTVRDAFADLIAIQEYVETVRLDLIENADIFLSRENGAETGPFPVATTKHFAEPQFSKYLVNVIVSHDQSPEGAPIIEEDLPTLANLIGRIEYVSRMGTLSTDFSMIKAGALHLANGGYLVLEARQVLMEPFAWDALKRSLRTGKISIYSPAERLSLVSTVSLVPEAIPLKLRVILVGERLHYYLLAALDPDFQSLFKLEADFSDHISANDDAQIGYARLIGTIAKQTDSRPLDAGAIARMFQESARITGDVERLTLNVDQLSDILREADFWAADQGQDVIRESDVEKAIAERERRASRVRDLSHEAIIRETMLIDTDGARIGQINALSVSRIGGFSFGRPSRLSARTRMGTGKVVDIERETELGGPIHSKGMLILQGYLATTYATDAPMSLWASLVFEQSYGGVDGDSASAAELLALLSSLSNAPIDQSYAITGSVNQFGDIQAIGGVNEKIEGFFDICAARKLTGRQGVLIPASNTKHLSLRRRVIDAVDARKFVIIPMMSISDGIEILFGMPAGDRDADGNFPEGTVNRLIEDRLRSFAETRKAFGSEMRVGEEQ